MTKNKVKIIAISLATVLLLVLVAGLIAHFVVKDKSQDSNDVGETFIVTPQNASKSMRLMAAPYSETSAISDACTVTAKTEYYSGKISWAVTWTGEEVFWDGTEKTSDVSDYVELTEQNDRTVLVQCLQPFGQPIKITATLADNTTVSDFCICNYKQNYILDKLQFGFNTFEPDGALGKGLILYNGIAPATLQLYESQTLEYSCEVISTSYTVKSAPLTSYPFASFSLTPNQEIIDDLGLGDFYFTEYYGTFENSLDCGLDGFFDCKWFENAVSATDYSVEDFAELLTATKNNMRLGIDCEPLYTLTVYGTAGERTYDYYFDLYDLNETVKALATVTLDNHEILFGGE